MKYTVALLIVTLSACKGHQEVVKPAETEVNTGANKPAWVNSRPISDMDYIGIGICPKSRPDHMESAKKTALNDLASEISVRVEGNSLLFTLDQKHSFDESFTSTVNTRTSEQLEGYEQVDTWQDDRDYWVYYRLSKSEHARLKAERKRKAIAQATDGYQRAKQSLMIGDLKGAFDQDLRALIAMKDYWGESDLVTIGEKQLPLANELFADLQRLSNGVRFTCLPERCDLNYGNRFKREMLISAAFVESKSSRDLLQLPITVTYSGAAGKVTESKNTDAEGRARTTVQRVELGNTLAELLVRLNMDELVSKDLDPLFIKPLIGSLTVPELHVPIDRTMPRVFVLAVESNMGQPVKDAGIALGLREELTAKGFRFVDRATDADLLLNINSTTREGGGSNGFFTAYLDVSYSFRDRKTNDVISEGGKQGVKGIQLDYAKAGMDAYKKAGQDLRKELSNAMITSLL
ncbi:MAG: LPP20 family lipoprotein [Flavobacteriales bacterium]|nr:LPP20 family lipoprotein [Flavobacteriales bacterium]